MDITLNLFHDNGFLRHCINDDPAETCDFSICLEDTFKCFGIPLPGIDDSFPQKIKIRISDEKFKGSLKVDTRELLISRFIYIQGRIFPIVPRTSRFVQRHFRNPSHLYVSFSVSK